MRNAGRFQEIAQNVRKLLSPCWYDLAELKEEFVLDSAVVISVALRFNPSDSEIPLAVTSQELCICVDRPADGFKQGIIAELGLSIVHWKLFFQSLFRCQYFSILV